MGPGDTVIRFREKIQGPRDQKIALYWAHAKIFPGASYDWCGFVLTQDSKMPALAASLCLAQSVL